MENLTNLNTSYSVIFRRIKQINDSDEVNYRKKDNKKLSDGYLINLVNSSPDLSTKKLKTLLGAYPSPIFKELKMILMKKAQNVLINYHK
jgi:hypothetical protein